MKNTFEPLRKLCASRIDYLTNENEYNLYQTDLILACLWNAGSDTVSMRPNRQIFRSAIEILLKDEYELVHPDMTISSIRNRLMEYDDGETIHDLIESLKEHI
jgi:hypothetical protein